METLHFKPIIENENLVSSSVFDFAKTIENGSGVLVAEIDPAFMAGKELCEHYGVHPSDGANCVIVEAAKTDSSEFVAVIVPVGYRADLNGFVRKYLECKRISLAPLDKVLQQTGMEYGSITPFGLPSNWKILVDALLIKKEKIIVGGGKQISKLLLPTSIFRNIPNVEVLEGLSKPIVQ